MPKKIIFLFALLIFPACQEPQSVPAVAKYQESRFLMGTVVRIDICVEKGKDETAHNALKEVWARWEDIHNRMSDFNAAGEVSRINCSSGKIVEVSSDIYQLLKEAVGYQRISQDAFNITVGPLMDLWEKCEKENRLPTQKEIQAAKSIVRASQIEFFPENRIRLRNKMARITLAGIVPGYAVDEARHILREKGLMNFLIDGGGELYASGHSCEGKPWRIGIRDPRDYSQLIDIIYLTDRAVSTSGNYNKYYEIQDDRLSRIINPLTGYPQKNALSATVIAPDATEADALSTALSVLGGQHGIALVDSLNRNLAAIIFEKKNKGQLIRFENRSYKTLR